MSEQTFTPTTAKRRNYPYETQAERPFISIDRSVFKKDAVERGEIYQHRKAIRAEGKKLSGHKFETLAVVRY